VYVLPEDEVVAGTVELIDLKTATPCLLPLPEAVNPMV
jgi:hypothetical protein